MRREMNRVAVGLGLALLTLLVLLAIGATRGLLPDFATVTQSPDGGDAVASPVADSGQTDSGVSARMFGIFRLGLTTGKAIRSWFVPQTMS